MGDDTGRSHSRAAGILTTCEHLWPQGFIPPGIGRFGDGEGGMEVKGAIEQGAVEFAQAIEFRKSGEAGKKRPLQAVLGPILQRGFPQRNGIYSQPGIG